MGLGDHTGRTAGMNESGGRMQKGVRGKWAHVHE